MGVVRK